MTEASGPPAPRIDVVGLGPAGPDLTTTGTRDLIDHAPAVFLRTRRHPAAEAYPAADAFDRHYESAPTFDDVYRSIVDELVAEARRSGAVVYAVPGSPVVAERTVVLLRRHPSVVAGEVALEVHPALSFLDVAFARLGVDPVASGVRIVDGESFATEAAGERGPLLVAQCWSTTVLSGVKLSAEPRPGTTVTLLHHLGLDDERIVEVAWDDLDRTLEPDHLTSLWIPILSDPVGAELVRLDELMHDLRQRCPWDREQTHGSLARHLMEESYEVLEAIDAVAAIDAVDADDAGVATGDSGAAGAATGDAEERAVAHLEEELGDLLFQVYFHATLAAEEGRFSLADVARGVHDKLVSRHPHLFAGAEAGDPGRMAADWEAIKKAEKGRGSITEGIPVALPALALAAKLQRKGLAVGMELPDAVAAAAAVAGAADGLARSMAGASGPAGGAGDPDRDGAGDPVRVGAGDPVRDGAGDPEATARLGDLLFAVVHLARSLGIDPESALRARAAAFRRQVESLG